jgi:hypothetical protein
MASSFFAELGWGNGTQDTRAASGRKHWRRKARPVAAGTLF